MPTVQTDWLVKRLAQVVVTIYAVISLTFALIRLIPGGPYDYLKAQLMSQGDVESIDQVRKMVSVYTGFAPNEPLWKQYLDYMSGVFLHFDLGKSFWYQEPVTQVYAAALPWTVFLMSNALLINFSFAIIMGALMAFYEGTRFDVVTTVVFQGVASVPYYIMALLLLIVLSYNLGWFPTGGRMPPTAKPGLNTKFVFGVIYYGTLPIASLVVTQLGRAIGMRANSIRVLGEDYLRVADLRGLRSSRIAVSYVAHNAILPLYTGLLISIGVLFGGSVILESIFNYPGMGWYLYKAVLTKDYTLMMGGFLLITLAVTVGVFIADLTYGIIDPRAQEGEAY